jgi:hypothetical protein
MLITHTNNLVAGGMFPYPAQASIQAVSKHEREFST